MANYPETGLAWREAMEGGIGLASAEGTWLHAEGTFPYERVERWVRETYAEIGPDFIDAVVRNLRGLVDWAYGAGSEPFWPGSDDAESP